jgi:transposase
MRDVELYRALLGLTAPWTVADVDVDLKGQRVVVRVEAGAGPYPCPECGTPTGRYDSKRRRWRHLDTMQFTTWIEADVPRVDCQRHGVKQIRVPWAAPGSQFTALFERLAIDLLRECSITGAVALLRITGTRGWGIKARAVKRGLACRAPEVVGRIGVDEKGHCQAASVRDDRGRSGAEPGAVPGGRSQTGEPGRLLAHADRDPTRGHYRGRHGHVGAVCQSTRAHLPGASDKIVFDKFHVVKHRHDAVDKVRRGEHRLLRRGGDDRLAGSKYLWLRRPEHMTEAQRAAFRALRREDLQVGRACALKERFRTFWEYRYLGAARTFFSRWFWRATHSRLKPMAAVAKLIQRHLPNLLTYLRHHLTNAGLEGVNAVIQWVKKTARGFRNAQHFKTAIYFHCGGLDLYPHESR